MGYEVQLNLAEDDEMSNLDLIKDLDKIIVLLGSLNK